jgi:putative transposase
MTTDDIFYRRNLPHIHPQMSSFFITFCLINSIPMTVLQRLKQEREQELLTLPKRYSGIQLKSAAYNCEKKHFAKFDEWLDRCSEGPIWLRDNIIADIVAAKLHEMDQRFFKLLAYTIMSNHVHLLIRMLATNTASTTNRSGKTRDYPVTDCLRLIKGCAARLSNKHLGRTGAFWHSESYDHYVRDEQELYRIVEYIKNNPVHAGLVNDWRLWTHTFVDESVSLM